MPRNKYFYFLCTFVNCISLKLFNGFPLTLEWNPNHSTLPVPAEHFLVRLNSLPWASYSCTEWTVWCPLKMDDQHLPRYILHAISLPRHILPICLHLLASSSFFKTQAGFASPSLSLSLSETISESISILIKRDGHSWRSWPQSTKSVMLVWCHVMFCASEVHSICHSMTIVHLLTRLLHWTLSPVEDVNKSLPPLRS